MIQDIVCEQLVAKKFEIKEIVKCACLLLTMTFILTVVVVLLPTIGLALAVVLIGLCAYLTYRLGCKLVVEYEYCFVNGEMTIDKIVSRSTRSRVFCFDVKSIEKIGKYDPAVDDKKEYSYFRNCSYSDHPTDAIYIYFTDKKHGKVKLVMSPNEKIMDSIKPFINKLVYREGFPDSNK